MQTYLICMALAIVCSLLKVGEIRPEGRTSARTINKTREDSCLSQFGMIE